MTMNSTARISDFYLLVIDDPIFWLILTIFGFLLSFITLAGNFILLVTIYRDPQKTLRSPPSLLIANLSVSDFLVGLCVLSLVAFKDVYRFLRQQVPLPDAMGPFLYYVLGTTLFVSRGTMIALSTCCFVAINEPIRYKVKITKKRICIFVAMIWVVSLLAMFFVSYTPQFITIHLALFCESPAIRNESVLFYKIDVIVSRFIFVNSAVNPFIYAWRMPKYRRALASLLTRRRKSSCHVYDSRALRGPCQAKENLGMAKRTSRKGNVPNCNKIIAAGYACI
ncbi:histamine H2 receptor-like [Acropora muricata]|uniref:histamine H2 receptor-like n=1 Tax=Acropora muricata TaxID=159855 RepID=UPI0034E3AC5E